MSILQKPIQIDVVQKARQYIPRILDGEELKYNDAYFIMQAIMQGKLPNEITASMLTALRSRTESFMEIAGFSHAMVDNAKTITVDPNRQPLIDIVGTGGAKFKSFNVSTVSSFILPVLGVNVAKHGNRSTTNKSGSADLLEALGINIMMDQTQATNCINSIGQTFLFAPIYHPAMKHVVPIRKQLRFRTIFNLLGPLTNPAHVQNQLTGVFSSQMLEPIAKALLKRNFNHVALVYSNIGADEITNVGTTQVVELQNGQITKFLLTPKDFGVASANLNDISNLPPEKAAIETIRIFNGVESARADFVAINAAMALRIADKTLDLKEATAQIQDTLHSGKVLDQLAAFVKISGGNYEHYEQLLEKAL